ncbi:hypothetical protein GJ744_005235 [Endocarpon pusillum]|uniref:Uncharacterized protein n=1 Tax=Endocarpon pusillum TaxID=364733 RepID=A0A8H7A7T2_9EURO|nr:hypothetical protein GJ744_005235 [Endocarpon pusillum]
MILIHVFKEETDLDIRHNINKTINSSNAPSRPDKRSRKDRAVRAIAEVGDAKFSFSYMLARKRFLAAEEPNLPA